MAIIIDATDTIVGRFSTVAAKQALLGEKVDIINCEKAIISGDKYGIIAATFRRRNLGTFKGPFYIRQPDRFVRRIIRGMLPYKQTRGRDAYKRIMCHVGVPDEFKDGKAIRMEEATSEKLPNSKYMLVGELCRRIGGKA
ncbi:MAG: 50S ribosomal protein L13 [Nanoarchaeota archaeon]